VEGGALLAGGETEVGVTGAGVEETGAGVGGGAGEDEDGASSQKGVHAVIDYF